MDKWKLGFALLGIAGIMIAVSFVLMLTGDKEIIEEVQAEPVNTEPPPPLDTNVETTLNEENQTVAKINKSAEAPGRDLPEVVVLEENQQIHDGVILTDS